MDSQHRQSSHFMPTSEPPRTVYLSTTLAWMAGLAIHAAIHVSGVLALPPTDEVYTATAPFQVTAFAYARGGLWLAGLLVVLAIEFAILGRKRS